MTRPAPNSSKPSADVRTDSRRSGFTLVEVLVAIVIFAIGFAMVAGVVPAGHLLNLQAEDDVLATICARNAVAAIEARKIYTPVFEHTAMRGTIAEGAYNAGLAGSANDRLAAANAGLVRGLEGSFRGLGSNRPSDGDTMADFEDALGLSPPPSVQWPASWGAYGGDCPGWSAASPAFRFLSDTDGNGISGDGAGPYPYADATDLPQGRIHAYHHRAGFGDALPGEDISYPGYTPLLAERTFLCTPLALDASANPAARRWVALVAVLRRHPGDSWPERGTDPAKGGCATGRAGADGFRLATPLASGMVSADTGNTHPNSGWAANAGFWNTYCVGGTDTDTAMPGLYSLPMIVYDFNNDLIEAQYPPCWTPGAYTPFVGAGIDRRLKAGDLFIAREGGTVFTVVSTRDFGADRRYQVLEVHPPLRTTLLGPNADPNWRLRAGYFAPPPASGGPSPLIRVETVPAMRGFTANPNH